MSSNNKQEMKVSLLKLFLAFMYSAQPCQMINENLVIKSIINELGIKHCIVLDDDHEKTIDFFKYFSRQNIYTKFMDVDIFFSYLNPPNFLDVKTAVLLKTNKLIEAFNNHLTNMDLDFVMKRFTWILMNKTTEILMERIEGFYVPYNSEFLIITPINETFYEISDIYNVGLTNETQKQKYDLGFWSQGELKITLVVKEVRRFDMLGEVVLFEADAEGICDKAKEFRNLLHDCYHIEILSDIGNTLNSTMNFYLTQNFTEEKYLRSTANIKGVSLDVNFFYPDVFGPIFSLTGYFHIKNDFGETHDISFYFAPFSRDMWFYTFISLFISSLVIFLIELLATSKKYLLQKMLHSSNLAFQPFDAFCNQCGSEISKRTPSRFAWLSTRVAASILVPAYSAAVISFITISIPKLPFTDLKTLLQDGTYKTSGILGTYGHFFFELSSDPTSKEIYEKLVLNDTPHNFEEGIHWMCKKNFKYAFVAYNKDLYELPHPECEIAQIPKSIFSVPTGLMMRLFCPYKKVYTMNLHRFYYSGILQKMKKETMGKPLEILKEDYMPLTINRIGPLFYIVLTGKIIAFLIFLIELLLKTFQVKKTSTLTIKGYRTSQGNENWPPPSSERGKLLLHNQDHPAEFTA